MQKVKDLTLRKHSPHVQEIWAKFEVVLMYRSSVGLLGKLMLQLIFTFSGGINYELSKQDVD